jgi:hypothetical protein
MNPKHLFIDQRFEGVCSYCRASADSRDHVPSRILLDEPYPLNLPIAESCTGCNQGFSASEEYAACLIECVKNGTTEPNSKFRPKIAATLNARPAIARRIEECKAISKEGRVIWQPEDHRVREVLLKLARGHVAHELGLQRIDEPVFEATPIPLMSEEQFQSFLEITPSPNYPEIGSRSFINVLKGKPTAYETWYVVQESTYQYAVGQSAGDWVKIVLGGYLACHVVWANSAQLIAQVRSLRSRDDAKARCLLAQTLGCINSEKTYEL